MLLATLDRAESFTQFLTVILVFILVLGLTYLTTRFVGSYQKAASINRNFEVIETLKITNGKYLQIVKIGEKYVVIGIGKDTVTKICDLDPSDIKPLPEGSTPQGVEAFKAIFDKAKERIKGNSKNEK